MKEYTVAVAGATGAVGNEMIKALEERKFPGQKTDTSRFLAKRRKDNDLSGRRHRS